MKADIEMSHFLESGFIMPGSFWTGIILTPLKDSKIEYTEEDKKRMKRNRRRENVDAVIIFLLHVFGNSLIAAGMVGMFYCLSEL